MQGIGHTPTTRDETAPARRAWPMTETADIADDATGAWRLQTTVNSAGEVILLPMQSPYDDDFHANLFTGQVWRNGLEVTDPEEALTVWQIVRDACEEAANTARIAWAESTGDENVWWKVTAARDVHRWDRIDLAARTRVAWAVNTRAGYEQAARHHDRAKTLARAAGLAPGIYRRRAA